LISFPNFVPQLYAGEGFNPNLIGIGWALAAVLLWGLSTVLGKYALGAVSFKAMTSLRFGLAFVFLLILNLVQNTIPPLASVTTKDWLYRVLIRQPIFSIILLTIACFCIKLPLHFLSGMNIVMYPLDGVKFVSRLLRKNP
jgi:drug/metabolite transporter (DMT)-like permease